MIAVLKEGTTIQQRDSLCEWFKSMGLEVHLSEGQYKTIIGLIGDTSKVDIGLLRKIHDTFIHTESRIRQNIQMAGETKILRVVGYESQVETFFLIHHHRIHDVILIKVDSRI